MFTLHETFEKNEKLMREALCETLIDSALENEDIIALDADLTGSSGMKPFFSRFPDRAIQCGIAEANMIGVAAGLSTVGKIPFAHTFACFASRRTCDQIMVSAAYAKLNLRIIATDPGVTAALNGGTHMPFEDMGVLRSIPDITLLEPSDPVMLSDLLVKLTKLYGVFYIRMARKEAIAIYEEGSSFEIGRGNVLRDGKDVTIIASGIMVADAMKAAAVLEVDGLSAKVIDMFTWKPIDEGLIESSARETGAVVTAENHNIMGGLGSAVSEVLVKTCPVPMEMVGVNDRFGQVGTEEFLRTEYGLTAQEIIDATKRVCARKMF